MNVCWPYAALFTKLTDFKVFKQGRITLEILRQLKTWF